MADRSKDDPAWGRPDPDPQPTGSKGERRPPGAGTDTSGTPSAGPHADPDLTDADKTPGAGTLPPVDGSPDQDSNAG